MNAVLTADITVHMRFRTGALALLLGLTVIVFVSAAGPSIPGMRLRRLLLGRKSERRR